MPHATQPVLEHRIDRPKSPTELPEILCLHGICAGAWVFPDEFITPWIDAGFAVHRISYRGHGASEGAERIQSYRLADYVSDVHSILEGFAKPPLVVGHSLGSAIAQVLLKEKMPLAGAVLMSPVPPGGLAAVSWRLLWSDPVAYQQLWVALTVGVKQVSERVGARLLFSKAEVSAPIVDFFARCTDESPWLAADLSGLPRIGPAHYDRAIDPPVWVVSGDSDRLIRPRDAAGVGDFYETDVDWVVGGSHMLMYDSGAQALAAELAAQWRAAFSKV